MENLIKEIKADNDPRFISLLEKNELHKLWVFLNEEIQNIRETSQPGEEVRYELGKLQNWANRIAAFLEAQPG